MCAFSSPSAPPPPPSPVQAVATREASAKDAASKERKRLASKTGGSAFQSRGFSGVMDTLLGNRVNKL